VAEYYGCAIGKGAGETHGESLFGGSSTPSISTDNQLSDEPEEEELPITLTSQELKELEAATVASNDDAELSGKLRDVQFLGLLSSPSQHDKSSGISREEAILEPVSVSIDFAVNAQKHHPRVCAFGVMPSIALGLSLGQPLRIISVGNACKKVQSELLPPVNDSGAASSMLADETPRIFTRSRSRTNSVDTAATEERKKAPVTQDKRASGNVSIPPPFRAFMPSHNSKGFHC